MSHLGLHLRSYISKKRKEKEKITPVSIYRCEYEPIDPVLIRGYAI
jgi:hypothetical protein